MPILLVEQCRPEAGSTPRSPGSGRATDGLTSTLEFGSAREIVHSTSRVVWNRSSQLSDPGSYPRTAS